MPSVHAGVAVPASYAVDEQRRTAHGVTARNIEVPVQVAIARDFQEARRTTPPRAGGSLRSGLVSGFRSAVCAVVLNQPGVSPRSLAAVHGARLVCSALLSDSGSARYADVGVCRRPHPTRDDVQLRRGVRRPPGALGLYCRWW